MPLLELNMSENKSQNHWSSTQDHELNEVALQQGILYLHQTHAYFELRIEHPNFVLTEQPDVIKPQTLEEDVHAFEHVYTIFDFGDRLITSKVTEYQIENQSMLKMFYTIEKIIAIMHDKIKKIEGGGSVSDDSQKEFMFYLDGHLLCLRKAFEVIINLPDNWLVMNFEPGEWGNSYISALQRLREKGYQYPPPAPRDIYRHQLGKTSNKPRLS